MKELLLQAHQSIRAFFDGLVGIGLYLFSSFIQLFIFSPILYLYLVVVVGEPFIVFDLIKYIVGGIVVFYVGLSLHQLVEDKNGE